MSGAATCGSPTRARTLLVRTPPRSAPACHCTMRRRASRAWAAARRAAARSVAAALSEKQQPAREVVVTGAKLAGQAGTVTPGFRVRAMRSATASWSRIRGPRGWPGPRLGGRWAALWAWAMLSHQIGAQGVQDGVQGCQGGAVAVEVAQDAAGHAAHPPAGRQGEAARVRRLRLAGRQVGHGEVAPAVGPADDAGVRRRTAAAVGGALVVRPERPAAAFVRSCGTSWQRVAGPAWVRIAALRLGTHGNCRLLRDRISRAG